MGRLVGLLMVVGLLASLLVVSPAPIVGTDDADATPFSGGGTVSAFQTQEVQFAALSAREFLDASITLTTATAAPATVSYTVGVRSASLDYAYEIGNFNAASGPVVIDLTHDGTLDPLYTPLSVYVKSNSGAFTYAVSGDIETRPEVGYNNAGNSIESAVLVCDGSTITGNVMGGENLDRGHFYKAVIPAGASVTLSGTVTTRKPGPGLGPGIVWRRWDPKTGAYSGVIPDSYSGQIATPQAKTRVFTNWSGGPETIVFSISHGYSGWQGSMAPYEFSVATQSGPECDADREAMLASNPLVKDPVNAATGSLTDAWVDIGFPAGVVGMEWARSYNSLRTGDVGVLGPGWSHAYEERLTETPGGVRITLGSGRTVMFAPAVGGGFDRPPAFGGDLVAKPDGSFEVEFTNGQFWDFDTLGRLVAYGDSTGATATIARTPAGLIDTVTSSLGPVLTFTYTAVGIGNRLQRLTKVESSDGREVSYGYDANNNLETVTLPGGGVERYTHDAQGRLLERRDEQNRLVVAMTYDANGRVATQTDGSGEVTTFTYDTVGREVTVADQSTGETMIYAYAPDGSLAGVEDPDGEAVTVSYTPDGQVASGVDRRGNTIVGGTYDAEGNMLSWTDAAGDTISYTYDSDNRMLTSTDARGTVTRFTYQNDERTPTTLEVLVGGVVVATTTNVVSTDDLLLSTTDPDGVTTTYTYDALRNVETATDENGGVTTYGYDAAGRHISTTTPLGLTTSRVLDDDGNITSVTDATGATWSMTYNAAGDVLTTTDPTAETVTFAYDAAGRRATATDERGKVTTYAYNTVGELIERTHPGAATETFTPGPILRTAAAQTPEGVAETFAFDDDGYLTGITDAATATTAFGYDTVGRVDEITDRTGLITTLGYDAAGAVASITDPVGTTTYGRDGFGRTTTVTAPDGGVTTTTYTPAGRVASITDARNKTTTHSYDNLGRLATVTNPLGGVTAYTYDADSRVVSVTTPANRTTSYIYDAANRVIATTDGTGAVWARTYTTRGELATEVNTDLTTVSYTWNPTGQLASVTDENNNTTSYGYDDRGNRVSRTDAASHVWYWAFDDDDRLISQTTPLGKTTTFTYDTVGRIDTVTDPDGRTETYGYDAEGRVTSRTYGGGVTTITYTYNAAGQLDTMVDILGTTRYTYDPAGRVASIRRPGGPTTSYEYDLAGNRTRMEFPDATFSTYTYDNNNRLKSVTHNQLGATTYNYDPDGNVWSEELSNNTRRAWSYDGAGRVSAFREGPVGGAQPLTTITRDNRGQVTSMTGHETGSFTYDDAGQLLTATGPGSATTRAYTYDSRGHTTAITQAGVTRTVLIDADGQLTKIGWGNSTLDDSGNHTVIWLHNYDRVTTTFNNRGLPATVRTKIGSVTTTETRTYDGHDRLARVEIDDGTPETFEFVWDEALPLAQVQSWRITGASGSSTKFVYGHGRIGTLDPAGTAAVHTETALGDTQTSVATADTSHSSTFGPFGEAPFTLNPAFGYRGELTIGHGVHLRARDYLPSVARFTEPDPLDGLDGTPVVASRYHYADNDPANRSDPTGMRTDLDAELRDLLGLRSQQQNRARRDAFEAVGLGAAVDAFDSLEACGRSLASGSMGGCPDGLTIVAGFVPGADCVAFVRSPSFGDGMWCAIDAASLALGGTAIRAGSIGVDHLRHSDEIADVTRWLDDTPHATRAPSRVPVCLRSFSADTEVLLEDGTTTKPISELRVGDEVWATDPETGESGPRRVEAVWPHHDWLVELDVEGGSVTTTEDHHFWNDTDQEWQETQHLDVGDLLLTPSGDRVAAGSLDWSTLHYDEAYDLTIEGIHSYYVDTGDDDVLVHNCTPLTKAEQRILGGLADDADSTAFDVLRSRGGGATNARGAGLQDDMGQWTLRDLAHAATNGDRQAGRWIKMIKQAGSQGKGGK